MQIQSLSTFSGNPLTSKANRGSLPIGGACAASLAILMITSALITILRCSVLLASQTKRSLVKSPFCEGIGHAPELGVSMASNLDASRRSWTWDFPLLDEGLSIPIPPDLGLAPPRPPRLISFGFFKNFTPSHAAKRVLYSVLHFGALSSTWHVLEISTGLMPWLHPEP